MSWAGDTVDALIRTFEGCFEHPVTMAVGAIDGEAEAVIVSPESAADALFEVGSVTKTMTATVLADLVLSAEVQLDDPIRQWLDAGSNGEITLEQLATHTSGLPRLAPNADDWEGFTEDDPYAGYGAGHAEEGLRSAVLSEAGAVAYSNFGYQLLGLVLERAVGAEFGTVLRTRLFDPLAMATACTSGSGEPRVQGYADGNPVPHWDLRLGGPGGVNATAVDMAAYLRALISPPRGRPGEAIRLAREPRVRAGVGQVGLGWHIDPTGLTWHNGGTGGFRSMLAADLEARRGAVALVSTADVGDALDAAVFLAVRGEDPTSARPEPVGPEWREVAERLVERVVSNDWEGVRAQMAAKTRDVLTTERLAQGWAAVMGPRGDLSGTAIRRLGRSGGVVSVDVGLEFPDGAGQLTVAFNDEAEVVGICIS